MIPKRKEKKESFWKKNDSDKNKKKKNLLEKVKKNKPKLKPTIPSRRKGKKK
jgi:hypothetical protein